MWFSAIGNIGPRIMPIIVTEIAAALKEGTSQTINWKLYEQYQVSANIRIYRVWDSQNRDESINVNGIDGPKLWYRSLYGPGILNTT